MAYPLTTTLIDDFNRANGAIGAAYTALAGGFNVSSNQIVGTGAQNMVFRASLTPPADCESVITVATLPATSQAVRLALRFSTSVFNGYALVVYNAGASFTWIMTRFTGGVLTEIGAQVTGQTLTAGDKIGFQVVGSSLIGYRYTAGAWSEVINRTDATYTAAASAVFGVDSTTARLDDFYCGAVTIGGVQSVTFGAMTQSATGTVASGGINGQQAVTFGTMTQVATGTVTSAGRVAAQAITFGAMTQVATATAPALTSIKLGIIGDSDFDEYRADDNRGGAYGSVTYGMTELLVRALGYDFGTWATRASPRRTGYERNWSLSGCTAGSLFQNGRPDMLGQGMHTGMAAHVTANQVDTVVIWMGENDFARHNQNYDDVYNGVVAGANLTAKINSIVSAITTATDAVLSAGAARVLVNNFYDPGPGMASYYPNATYRQRVTDAINNINGQIASMVAARAPQAALMDKANIVTTLYAEHVPDGNGSIVVNGQTITATSGDEPHNQLVSDGHTGTVYSGLFTNIVLDRLNAAFNLSLARMSDSQITAQAGMGMAQITGTQAITFAAMTSAGTATVLTHAAQSVTFAGMTQAATGTVANRAAQSKTFGAMTQAATGKVQVRGAQAVTFGAMTSSGAAVVVTHGTQVITFGAMTQTAGATNLTHGTQAATFGAMTQVAAGTVVTHGAQVVTFGTMTQTASGVVGAAPNIAQQAITFGTMTQTAAGKVITHGTQAVILSAMTQTASGTVITHAQQVISFGAMTQIATGIMGALPAITGTQAITFGAMTQSAYGIVGVSLYRAAEDILAVTPISDLHAAESIWQTTQVSGLRYKEDIFNSDLVGTLRAAEDIL